MIINESFYEKVGEFINKIRKATTYDQVLNVYDEARDNYEKGKISSQAWLRIKQNVAEWKKSHNLKESSDYKDDERKNIRLIVYSIINAHGENYSIGKFDRFIQRMINQWANTGHDSEFYLNVINKAYEKEFK